MSKKLFLLFSALAPTTTASHLRTDDPLLDDTKLEVLATTAKVIDKELRLLEHENRPQLLSSWIGKYQHKLGTAATAAPTQQRFEAAVSVPDACPAECKSAWTKLSDIYAKYYECTPKCDEEFLKEKTQTSEAVDESCMIEQQCWEAIEEVLFTKPAPGQDGEDLAGGGDATAVDGGDATAADGDATVDEDALKPPERTAKDAAFDALDQNQGDRLGQHPEDESVKDALVQAATEEMAEKGSQGTESLINAGKDELAKHGAIGALGINVIDAAQKENGANGMENMKIQEGANQNKIEIEHETNSANTVGADGAAALGSDGPSEESPQLQGATEGATQTAAAVDAPEKFDEQGNPVHEELSASGNETPPESTATTVGGTAAEAETAVGGTAAEAETGPCKDNNDCPDGQVCTLGDADRTCSTVLQRRRIVLVVLTRVIFYFFSLANLFFFLVYANSGTTFLELSCSAPRDKDEKCMSPEHKDCTVTGSVDLVCKEGTCQAIECTQTSECPVSSYCDIPLLASLDPGETHCQRMLGYGEHCAVDGGCIGELVCVKTEQGLDENGWDSVCSNRKKAGEPCQTNEEDEELNNCETGMLCINTGQHHTCSETGKVNEQCLLKDRKSGESSCDPASLFCKVDNGLDGTCQSYGNVGDTCSGPSYQCAEGLTCKMGGPPPGECQVDETLSKFKSVPSVGGTIRSAVPEVSGKDKYEMAFEKSFD